MSKVVILWFNFSSSTYPDGSVSSGLSLYTADLVYIGDKVPAENQNSNSICNCGGVQKRSIDVTNRRNTYLDIKDIRTHCDRSAVNERNSRLLRIEIFYKQVVKTIKEHYNQTFDFADKNMAVLVDEGERFDDLKILEAFKVKLAEYYQFNAPIDMSEVAVSATNEEEVDAIPFMNKGDGNINEFINWISSICPSLQ